MASNVERVDDNDLAKVEYSGVWQVVGVPEDYEGTVHRSRTAGNTATFKFNGIGIQILGTVGRTDANLGPAISSYQLDSRFISNFTAPNQDRISYSISYFTHANLEATDHTLVITHAGGSAFYLDEIQVTKLSEASLPSPSSTISPSGSSSSPMESAPRSRTMVGAVAGGTVGGVVFLLLVGITVLLLRRRKRRAIPSSSSSFVEPKPVPADPSIPTPYPMSPGPDSATSTSGFTLPTRDRKFARHTNTETNSEVGTSIIGTSTANEASTYASSMRSPGPAHATDPPPKYQI